MATGARSWHADATRGMGVAALVCGVLAFALSACAPRADTGTAKAGSVRVLSWNVESDAFARDPVAFRALIRKAQPDILLLDEVAPTTNEDQIRNALAGVEPEGQDRWYLDFGPSGGRQRDVIVSRMPLERLPEFSNVVRYPEEERRRIYDGMVAANEVRPQDAMDGGIPMNGVVITAGSRRLLVVGTDLQAGGDDPGSWQEYRRRIETAEIRRRVRQVLARTSVDGILVAGDFNLVSTALPLVIASGPYPPPHDGLLVAELRHLDSLKTWTIENQGRNAFPNAPFDFMLYSSHSLGLREGYVLDSADLSPGELEQLGLEPESANRLSDHRPLVAEFVWH